MKFWKFAATRIGHNMASGEERTRWIRADQAHEVHAGPTSTKTKTATDEHGQEISKEVEVPSTMVLVHYGPPETVSGGSLPYLVNSVCYRIDGRKPESVVKELEALLTPPAPAPTNNP